MPLEAKVEESDNTIIHPGGIMNWDAYHEYNLRDVAMTHHLAEVWRAMEIQRIKDRWGIFWRIGLWLHDHLPRKPHYKRM